MREDRTYFASLPRDSFFFVSGSSKDSFSPGRRKVVVGEMWHVNFTKVSVLVVGVSSASKHFKLASIVPMNKSEIADLLSPIAPEEEEAEDEEEAEASAAAGGASIPGTWGTLRERVVSSWDQHSSASCCMNAPPCPCCANCGNALRKIIKNNKG